MPPPAMAGDQQQQGPLGRPGVKRLLLTLERAISKNQEQRMKHSDDPIKFLESELALDVAIRQMDVLATLPEFYDELVRIGSAHSLVRLLAHDNVDVAVGAARTLAELSDPDVIDASGQGTVELAAQGCRVLAEALVGGELVSLLCAHLRRLDDLDAPDPRATLQALAIVENMAELVPDKLVVPAADGVGDAGAERLFTWLLERATGPAAEHESDAERVQFYAAELLALVLQANAANVDALFPVNDPVGAGDRAPARSAGDVVAGRTRFLAVLAVVARYQRDDPRSADEQEFVENLFACIDSVVMRSSGHATGLFCRQCEGVELMVLVLKAKKFASKGALKTLQFALESGGEPASVAFVGALGLKSLFRLLVKLAADERGDAGGRRRRSRARPQDTRRQQEHVLACLLALLRALTGANAASSAAANAASSAAASAAADRLLFKFRENDFEKCAALVALHDKFYRLVLQGDREIRMELARAVALGQTLSEADEQAMYLRRLDAGLYPLQLVDQILALVCSQQPECLVPVLAGLKAAGAASDGQIGPASVHTVLSDYALNMVDGGAAEDAPEVQAVIQLAGVFAVSPPPPPVPPASTT